MLQGEYLGMTLTIEDVDKENVAFFNYCAEGDFRLQRGKKSGLLLSADHCLSLVPGPRVRLGQRGRQGRGLLLR